MKLLNSKYPSSAEYFIFHAISSLGNVLFGPRNDVSMVRYNIFKQVIGSFTSE